MIQITEQLHKGKENPETRAGQRNTCALFGGSLLLSFRSFPYHNFSGFSPEEPVSIESLISP
jgi:hypothetical protein